MFSSCQTFGSRAFLTSLNKKPTCCAKKDKRGTIEQILFTFYRISASNHFTSAMSPRAFLFIICICCISFASAQVSLSTGGMDLWSSMHSVALVQTSTKAALDTEFCAPPPYVNYLNTASITVGFFDHLSYPASTDERPFIDVVPAAPATAAPGTVFTFVITYTDLQNDPPAASTGAPRLFIKKGIQFYDSNPQGYAMTFTTGTSPMTGLQYSCKVQITAPGNDYSYYFTAADIYGNSRQTSPLLGRRRKCLDYLINLMTEISSNNCFDYRHFVASSGVSQKTNQCDSVVF